jgi:hypothetical protein
MMNIAAKFSLSSETKVYRSEAEGANTTEGDAR